MKKNLSGSQKTKENFRYHFQVRLKVIFMLLMFYGASHFYFYLIFPANIVDRIFSGACKKTKVFSRIDKITHLFHLPNNPITESNLYQPKNFRS